MKYDLFDLSVEELMLLQEEAEDRLKDNPLDDRALLDYNICSKLIDRLNNA